MENGYGISWKMWMPHIDVFIKDYFVIVPILDGHDTENSSTFTTVEKAATDIIDYVTQIYGEHIFAICGASLGGTIGIEVLAQDRLKVDKAIIDGGPVVPMNKLLLSFSIKMRIKQAHRMKKGSKLVYYMLSHTYFPKELVEEIMRVGSNMKDESCRNAHLSVFRYSLPASIANVKTYITYWYGSKEARFGKKYAKAILKVLPNTKIKVFKGFEHGELCIGNPKLYTKHATEFFEA
jgi:pimeloyl-ACP methyl ester carboxylesterase